MRTVSYGVAVASVEGGGAVGGVRLGRVLLVAGLLNVLGLAANSAASFVTDRADGALRWILPPAIGLAAALLAAGVQAVSAAEPQQPAYRSPYYPRQTRPRGVSMPVAVLLVVLICGVGAVGITVGVRYVVGYVSGSESGEDRLVRPVSARAGTLTLRVDKVEDTSHFTRVELVARNAGRSPVSLPLFGNCVLTAQDGTTLQADSFRSRWSTTIAAGATQRGTVTFPGHLPDGVTKASLSFSTVFTMGGGSITVPNLRLRPG